MRVLLTAGSCISYLAKRMHQDEQVPFCDQNFKLCRLAINSIFKFPQYMFYISASYVSRRFSENYSTYYNELSAHYFEQVRNRITTYRFMGESVINFNCNHSSSRINGEFFHVKTFEDLKKIYGESEIDRWNSTLPDELSLENDLKVPYLFQTGCCFGISLDFINNFLKAIKAGKTPLDAIKLVSCRYKNGAQKQAELAQIIHVGLKSLDLISSTKLLDDYDRAKAIEIQKNHDEEVVKIQKEYDEKFQKLNESLEYINKFIDLRGNFEANSFLIYIELMKKHKNPSLAKDLHSLTQNYLHDIISLKNKFSPEIFEYQKKIYSKINNLVSEKYGLKIAQTIEISIDHNNFFNDIISYFVNLKKGIYQVDLPQHSLCFIKTDNENYLFDPNFGTFKIDLEKDAFLFCNIIAQYYFESNHQNSTIRCNLFELLE
ncbi:MAG: hypothetical protein KR126chlam6_00855 [Candidatus Anoxychlamydiales bacterium]|nr:hypothetical protein [Candidatus Anoxychlamydiales bacterium]